jgi:probable HAF family extracellular repeat protein
MKVRHRAKISLVLLATLSFIVALASHLGATEYILYNLDSTTQVNQGGDAAYGINDLGQVVGGIQPGAGGGQAWIWDWNTKVKTPLTKPSGYNYSIARGINDSGVITGTFSVDGGPVYGNTAFIYNTKTSTPEIQLLTTTSGKSSDAYAINNSGQIVGTSYTYDPYLYIGSIRAFKFDGTMHDLGTLPDYVDSDGNHYPLDVSQAFAINNSGQAAGLSGGMVYPQGVLFSNGTVQNLGNLAGVTDPRDTNIYTIARGMNDKGDIVGLSAGRAFL